jgi:hypothetical protein
VHCAFRLLHDSLSSCSSQTTKSKKQPLDGMSGLIIKVAGSRFYLVCDEKKQLDLWIKKLQKKINQIKSQ